MPKKSNRDWISWDKLKPEEARRRRKAAIAAIRKLFAEVVPLWPGCGRGSCRRHHRCHGDFHPCLKRSWPLLSPAAQQAAHSEVMKGGPRRLAPKTRSEWELRSYPPAQFVD